MIEADLERHYQRDLCDLWRGRLTIRKLRVLIDGLPPDSATVRALSEVDDRFAGWTLTDVLMGRLVDQLALFHWHYEQVHREKKAETRPRPKSVLPDPTTAKSNNSDIPVVSPHALGGFLNNDT